MRRFCHVKKTRLAVAIAQAVCFSAANAATITVNSLGDVTSNDSFCTLREAVVSANTNDNSAEPDCVQGAGVADTIVFEAALNGGIIRLTQTDSLAAQAAGESLTIQGPGAANLSIDAYLNGGAFFVNNGSTLTVNDLTVTGGSFGNQAGAFYLLSGGKLNLNKCTITGNTAGPGGYGGAIYGGTDTQISINNCQISNNSATKGGGAIALKNAASLLITSSSLTGNTAAATGAVGAGGAIFIDNSVSGPIDATLTNVTISQNHARTTGGGIRTQYQGDITLVNSTVSSNVAEVSGGGISVNRNTTLSMTGGMIQNNISSQGGGANFTGGDLLDGVKTIIDGVSILNNTAVYTNGGGIYADYYVDLQINSSTISSNQAMHGGGIFVKRSHKVSISDSQFRLNNANMSGGALYLKRTSPVPRLNTIYGTTFDGNTATTGGGIFIEGELNLSIVSSTISNNSAVSTAGGLYLSETTASIVNSTISENRSYTPYGGDSGGIAMRLNSDLNIAHSTLSDNFSYVGGAAVSVFGDSMLKLDNSIVAGNYVRYGLEIAALSTEHIDFLGVNFLGENSRTTAQVIGDGIDIGNSILGTSDGTLPTSLRKLISALGDNGGLTKTHALKAGSPAINSAANANCGPGKAVQIDQTGELRNDGRCDIGSVEFINDDLCIVVKAANEAVAVFCL